MTRIRKTVDRDEQFQKMVADGEFFASLFDVFPRYLAEQMGRLHGQDFRVVIDHDAPMILIRPK